MAPVVLVVDMGLHRRRDEKKIKKDLMKIPGVVEVCVSLVTGHVAIVGTADPATLGEALVARLRRNVFLLADFGAAPAPPVGGGYGYGAMPLSSPAPSSHLPAPPVGGYYSPYAGHNQLRYATPPPEAGYYYTPFGDRPWGPHYMGNDAPPATFEDEGHNDNGCCCSIQ